MNYGKITEKYKIDAEIISITSAAGATSLQYDMKAFEQALVAVNVEGSYIGGVTIDLMESSAATAAGSSAAGSKAGIVIGGTAATNIAAGSGVRKMTLTMGTASTADEFFTLAAGTVTKKFTYTTSTAAWASGSTLQTATNLYFGTTVGSTVNAGIQGSLDSLKTAIESTLGFGGAVICSTPTTDAIGLEVADSAAGALGLTATAVMSALVNQAVGCFDIRADQLTSTANKRFISAKVSTASTACRAAVTVIRGGGRYLPASGAKYKLSS
jgi:hypothetical protein